MLKNLKILRKERKISQKKLAEVIGMSQSSINDYENRGIEPDIDTLVKLADYFEVSLDFLVDRNKARRKIDTDDSEYALDQREAVLVDRYRVLPDSSRKVIDDLIAEMVSLQEMAGG